MKKLNNFPYSHVLVLGLAKSGTAAARLLLDSNVHVRINDKKMPEDNVAVADLKKMGAEMVFGSHPVSVLKDVELIIKNPGIPYDNPIIAEAEKKGIPIITEIELAGQLAEGRIIGITGSNGKTTTTTLIKEMLFASNQKVKAAGNIGTAATDAARKLEHDEMMVLELSSFQLLGIQTFKPRTAVLLNIYEAHIDYHKTFKNYKMAKCNIFANQTSEDYLVYNNEDETVAEAVKSAQAQLIPFSTKEPMQDGAWADETSIYFRNEKIMDRQDIVLVGDHNLENILAATSAAKLNGANNQGIRKVLATFAGVKHRLQFAGNVHDRLFYNDSKATNILATQKALSSFKQPVILLAGGLDRGNGFTGLQPYLHHVKAMVLFGQTAEKLKKLAEEAGIEKIEKVADIHEAVNIAYAISEPRDVILLSPACASWDQYRTFEERGDMFINAVHTLM